MQHVNQVLHANTDNYLTVCCCRMVWPRVEETSARGVRDLDLPNVTSIGSRGTALRFYSACNASIASAVLATAIPSVRKFIKWAFLRMRSENMAKNCPKCCQIAKI